MSKLLHIVYYKAINAREYGHRQKQVKLVEKLNSKTEIKTIEYSKFGRIDF